MKRNKIKCGLPVTRIDYKHAWYFSCIDNNNVAHIIMFSYDTPIFVVSNVGNTPDAKLHVVLNENAYNYSRTTSKQISQWISHLHLFTTRGCILPWSFKHVINLCKKNDIHECTLDYVEYDIVSESVLKNICYAFGYASLPYCNLYNF